MVLTLHTSLAVAGYEGGFTRLWVEVSEFLLKPVFSSDSDSTIAICWHENLFIIFSKTQKSAKLLLPFRTNDLQKQIKRNGFGAQFAHTM